jgi:hypothetical protein
MANENSPGDMAGHKGPFEIVVNGQLKKWPDDKIGWAQLVELAYPGSPIGKEFEYTITYTKGPPGDPSGTLLEGHSVRVKDRMVFDVVKTIRS